MYLSKFQIDLMLLFIHVGGICVKNYFTRYFNWNWKKIEDEKEEIFEYNHATVIFDSQLKKNVIRYFFEKKNNFIRYFLKIFFK